MVPLWVWVGTGISHTLFAAMLTQRGWNTIMNGRLDALDPPPLPPDAATIALHTTNNNDGGGGGDDSVEPEDAAAAAVHGFTSQARAEAEVLERHEEELRESVGQYLRCVWN